MRRRELITAALAAANTGIAPGRKTDERPLAGHICHGVL